jgi:hypothetical protein
MIDGEGNLGDPDEKRRGQAVENHYKWVEAAKALDCHSIRVNAGSSGTYEEQQKRAADGLRRLSEFAATHKLNVIVENHGGLSSNGAWLAGVMKAVNLPIAALSPTSATSESAETNGTIVTKALKSSCPSPKPSVPNRTTSMPMATKPKRTMSG